VHTKIGNFINLLVIVVIVIAAAVVAIMIMPTPPLKNGAGGILYFEFVHL